MKIHIIGGGIIGLCAAYYLQKAGHEIEIIDKDDLLDGCSFGNAGMIVPSHFIPLAAPGVITKGLKWLFDSKSPFYIKPRLNFELLQWLWQFYRSCSPENLDRGMPALKDLSLFSKALYQELHQQFDFSFEEKGLLMLYKNAKTEAEEIEVAEKANALGIKAKVLSATQVQELENGIKMNVKGAVFYPGDAHLYPNALMEELQKHLLKTGVQFRSNTTVTGFDYQSGQINHLHLSNGEKVPVEQVVIAAGSWSGKVLKNLGIRLLVQDGKGYSLTLNKNGQSPSIPSILTEAKVAMTPMDNYLRIGGTLEISNFNPRVNKKRLEGIVDAVPDYYPELQPSADASPIWHGFRPCTPDGLPYIGASKKFDNLVIAAGHAMMGLSLGPATGKLVSEIINHQKTTVNLEPYIPERF